MAQNYGGKFAKLILIVFNLVFWMSGAVVLAVGLWLLVDPDFDRYYDIQETTVSKEPIFKYAAYTLLAIGCFAFMVGFVGCIGAFKENKYLLGLYMMFMFIIMAGELAAGIFVLVYKETAKSLLKDSWKSAINATYGQNSAEGQAFTQAQDTFQIKMRCCGADGGYMDYDGSYWTKMQEPAIRMPDTCCLVNKGAQNATYYTVNKNRCQGLEKNSNISYFHDKNCFDALTEWLDRHALILIGVGIGVAFVEMFGFIFSVMLCRHILGYDKKRPSH